MMEIGSVRIRFKEPLKPAIARSPIVALKGLAAEGIAEGILRTLEARDKPISEGPYAFGTSGRLEELARVLVPGKDLDDAVTKVSLFTAPRPGDRRLVRSLFGLEAEIDGRHVHQTDEVMTPATLVAHSEQETGSDRLVASEPEDMAILLTALFRSRGLRSYLSETTRVEDDHTVAKSAGVCVLGSSEAPIIDIAVGVRTHPETVALTVYGDEEVGQILTALQILNQGKRTDGAITDPMLVFQVLELSTGLEHSIIRRLLQETDVSTRRLPMA
ncbi:hypothetical protein J4450_02000 [Candidatus Micrarchaeota archaeon]|nr:hypothetical protein [Candidatus Micrarchaeota archaeon]